MGKNVYDKLITIFLKKSGLFYFVYVINDIKKFDVYVLNTFICKLLTHAT